jgi:hypothetical protein
MLYLTVQQKLVQLNPNCKMSTKTKFQKFHNQSLQTGNEAGYRFKFQKFTTSHCKLAMKQVQVQDSKIHNQFQKFHNQSIANWQ